MTLATFYEISVRIIYEKPFYTFSRHVFKLKTLRFFLLQNNWNFLCCCQNLNLCIFKTVM